MSLILHYHPLSSFCWKVLIALYEADLPFEGRILDFGDEAARTAFFALWPIGKFPVLQDEDRGVVLPEASIQIEHLALHYPSAAGLVPKHPDTALQVRLKDRIFDNYLQIQFQKVVGDRLRPQDQKDPLGVQQAHDMLRRAYGWLEQDIGDRDWAVDAKFTLADCSAAPALFYGDKVEPFGEAYPRLSAYLQRLKRRPSVARVLKEAEPYFHMFPAS